MSSTNNDGYAMAELTPADADLTMLWRMICSAPRRAQTFACMGWRMKRADLQNVVIAVSVVCSRCALRC